MPWWSCFPFAPPGLPVRGPTAIIRKSPRNQPGGPAKGEQVYSGSEHDTDDKRPRVAVTMGDPASVGPELVARICYDGQVRKAARLVVVGQSAFLRAGARACGLPMPAVEVVEVGDQREVAFGRWSADSGRLAGQFVETALAMCLDGTAEAMATAPISKEALQAGGYPDTGHTTMLARLTGTPRPVMMLAGDRLRVVLATIHCSIRQVLERLTTESIVQVGATTAAEMKAKMGFEQVRMAVAGLNPHAGEGGLFGDEEERIIEPAVEQLQAAGIEASGPHPPDTVFWKAVGGHFDVVLCMYHDQGLIPLKLMHFEDGVNITLGLPVIRTSVDHGTAYDIAGTGEANDASLRAAILMAASMAEQARTQP